MISFPFPVYADPPSGDSAPSGIPNPSQWINNDLIPGLKVVHSGLNFFTLDLIPFIINALFFLVIVVSLIFLIIGGIQWTTSGGDKEGTSKAKNTVTYAVIGLILGLSSWIIIGIISCYFNTYLGMTLNCDARTFFLNK